MRRWWVLAGPAENNEYCMTTAAGDIHFDNASTRSIMHQLAQGPMQLTSIDTCAAPDLLNSIDIIYMAELAVPVDAPGDPTAAARLNAVLAAHGNPINASATAYGAINA